jgi:hypothetical protein
MHCENEPKRSFLHWRVGSDHITIRRRRTAPFVDLQLILEKACTPNQLLIATSSMMGGLWS